jgi:hypothetical protein
MGYYNLERTHFQNTFFPTLRNALVLMFVYCTLKSIAAKLATAADNSISDSTDRPFNNADKKHATERNTKRVPSAT